MVAALEAEIDQLELLVEQPKEFVLPGESMTGAGLDLARTSVRRPHQRLPPLTGNEAARRADTGGATGIMPGCVRLP